MIGRGWCLLAGLLLMTALLAGQQQNQHLPVRLAAPAHAGVTDPHVFPPVLPPVRRPVLGLPVVPAPGGIDFAQLTRAAGMIFAGTVVRIERQPAIAGQTIETVAVTFQIENSIRGTVAGSDLTIRQWSGVWSFGQRYRRGERVLLFLYPRSRLGLTSCVGGQLGRLALDSAGRVLFTAEQRAAFRTDSVLGGKSRLPFSDFALAVRRAGEEE